MPSINIAVVGDKGVGKTSLILAAGRNTFREGSPTPVLQPTTLRVQLRGIECSCVCYDTASDVVEDILAVVRRCDVVLICFSAALPATLRNALTKWLPQVVAAHPEVPVILVGCKNDLGDVGDAEVAEIEATMARTINVVRLEWSSAKSDRAVDVLELATDACLHPVMPLFHHVKLRLRCRAIRAFNRIFELIDEDKDGALSDTELTKFHKFAYGREVDALELQKLRQLLIAREADTVTTEGVVRKGFMNLQTYMIMEERVDLTWSMLHMFGYNHSLELLPELFQSIPDRSKDAGTVAMLSREALAFLVSHFNRRAASGLLPIALLLQDAGPQSFFRNAPPTTHDTTHPLGRSHVTELLTATSSTGVMPLESFLCIWAYCAFVDARRTVMAMVYMGFPDTYPSPRHVVGSSAAKRLLKCAPRRKPPSLAPIPRPLAVGVRVFNCLLFGSIGCGKTSLLQRFSGCTDAHRHRASSVTPDGAFKAARFVPGDPDTMLVVVEVPEVAADQLPVNVVRDSSSLDRLLATDALIFAYDATSTDSFRRAASLLTAISDATLNAVPATLLSLKSDLGVSNELSSAARAECSERCVRQLHGLAPECTQADAQAWARDVLEIACNKPTAHIALTPSLAAKRRQQEARLRVLKWSGVALACSFGALVVYALFAQGKGEAEQVQREGAPKAVAVGVTKGPAASPAAPRPDGYDIATLKDWGSQWWGVK